MLKATWVMLLALCLPGLILADLEGDLLRAGNLFERGEWQQALELYAELARSYPDNARVHVGLGASAARLHDYPKAIAALHRAEELMPGEPILLGELADAYRQNDQLDEAEIWYQRAITAVQTGAGDQSPLLADPYIGLGLVQMERGDLEEAVESFQRALQFQPDLPAGHHYLGDALLQLNRLNAADAAYARTLKLDDSLAYAHYGRGQIATRRRDFSHAEAHYLRAVQLESEEPKFHYALAQIYLRLGKREAAQRALADYRRAESELYRQDAHRLVQEGQWRDALARLQKAVEHDRTNIAALRDKAFVEMRLGELDAAEREYEQVLQADPDALKPRLYLAQIALQRKQPERAEAWLIPLMQVESPIREAYPLLAQAREDRDDWQGAMQVLEQALSREPEWTQGYWRRGRIWLRLGQRDKAKADFRRAVALDPDASVPKLALVQLLVDQQASLAECLDLLRPLVEASHPEALALTAWVHHQLGHPAEAARYLERARRIDPRHPEVERVQQQIDATRRMD